MYLRLILFFLLFIITQDSHAITIQKGIVEKISDKVSLQVLSSASNKVSINIEIATSSPSKLKQQFNDIAYKHGYELDFFITPFTQRYIFSISTKYWSTFLESLERILGDKTLEATYINIILIGNLPEQKVVGELYRILKNVSILESPQTTPINILSEKIGSYRKNPDESFSKLIASFIRCKGDVINKIEFKVIEDTVMCELTGDFQNFNQGQLANIVQGYKGSLIRTLREPTLFVSLLGNISVDDNLHFVDALKSYLSDISLESINQHYQELSVKSQQKVTTTTNIDTIAQVSLKSQALEVLEMANEPLGVAIVLHDSFSLCSFFDCDTLNKSLEIQFVEASPSVIKVDYDKSFARAGNEVVVNTILRPLLITGYPPEKITIYKLGSEQSFSFNELPDFESFLPQQSSLSAFKRNGKCLEDNNLNSRTWIFEKVLIYGVMNKLDQITSFQLLTNNCSAPVKDMHLELHGFLEELNDRDFELIKNALLNRLQLLEGSNLYPLFEAFYGYPIIKFHSDILSKLTLAELKLYTI